MGGTQCVDKSFDRADSPKRVRVSPLPKNQLWAFVSCTYFTESRRCAFLFAVCLAGVGVTIVSSDAGAATPANKLRRCVHNVSGIANSK